MLLVFENQLLNAAKVIRSYSSILGQSNAGIERASRIFREIFLVETSSFQSTCSPLKRARKSSTTVGNVVTWRDLAGIAVAFHRGNSRSSAPQSPFIGHF